MYINIYLYLYIHIHTFIHMYIHAFMHSCVCVCVCVCVGVTGAWGPRDHTHTHTHTQVSRALGDHAMKQSVISEPHFWEDDINVDDAFVIIACDGLVFITICIDGWSCTYHCVILYRLLWYGFVII